MVRFRTFIADEITPRSRPDDRAGIGQLPGGEELYRSPGQGAHHHRPGAGRDPRHRPARGRAHRRRDRASWAAACSARATLAETQDALRGDPQLHFASADEIEAVAEASLRRAARQRCRTGSAGCRRRLRGGAHAAARGEALDHRLLPRAGDRRLAARALLHQHLRSRPRGRATRRRRSPSTRRCPATTCRSRSRRS